MSYSPIVNFFDRYRKLSRAIQTGGSLSPTTVRIFYAMKLFVIIFFLGIYLVAFDQNGWGQSLYKPGVRLQSETPTLLDGFGFSVASEGEAVIVGSPHAVGDRGQMGKAFLFLRETGKVRHTLLPPSPVGDDLFGLSVGINQRFIIVGAPRGKGKLGRVSGMVAVFDRNNGKLVHEIVSPNSTASVFGHALAIHGPWLAIGDPGASSPTNFEVGEVYVFELATGRLVHTFSNPGVQQGKPDGFGHALSFLGTTLLIGAPLGGVEPRDHGKVYMFDVQTGKLMRTLESPEPQTHEYFGMSLATDADSLLVGALGHGTTYPESGATYLFTTQGKFQKKFIAPDPQKGDHFGEAVTMVEDYYVIAAPGDDASGTKASDVDVGAVFVYDKKTKKLRFTIPNPSKSTGTADLFGLSMHGDGPHLVVGAPYGDLAEMPDAGEVYQFNF